jgi:hypothetical protein
MFMNYNKFKEEIWRAFSVIDENMLLNKRYILYNRMNLQLNTQQNFNELQS